jgi:hypothetical protein
MADTQLMQSRQLAGSKPAASTQQYLDIAEIRDDVVVMKDGTMRIVLLASSVNFSLKSEEEQQATIGGYVSFLNTLEEPVQICIQSRKLNIDDYLNRLKEQEKNLTNELLRTQIADYRNFVSELVDLGDIMQKKFMVIVPYNPVAAKRKSFYSRMLELMSPLVSVKLKEERFRQRKTDLMTKVDAVRAAMNSMGIVTAVLDTQSLIELYYSSYNPQSVEAQKLEDVNRLRIEE